jgi:histidinol dehydrogenase
MKTYINPDKNTWPSLSQRAQLEASNLKELVESIYVRVASEGDKALLAYTAQFDGVDLKELKFDNTAEANIDPELETAIKDAANNIRRFHKAQRPNDVDIETMPGVRCQMLYRPLETAAIYIPGGTAPLFSTVLMLAIPALEAGVKNIYILTPPDKNGGLNPVISRTAQLLGIQDIFLAGGAQAIAAAALGTESITKADIITGPGNQYVTEAKNLAQSKGVLIDMPAGPSELLVWADATCKAKYVASDLLSQAEHGSDSQVILLCDSIELVDEIQTELDKQIKDLERISFAEKALQNSRAIVLADEGLQIDFVNQYAPEHLIIVKNNAREYLDKIENAGSVFLGNYTPESAGDYASGTNHTLPTYGFAKNYSGVSLRTFLKSITVQEIDENGMRAIGPKIEKMAEAELLGAHKNAVTLRLNDLL